MATIGSLLVNLTLGSEAFQKNLGQTRSNLGDWQKFVDALPGFRPHIDTHLIVEGLEKTRHLIEGAFAAIGIGLGVGEIKEFVRETLEAAESANNLSQSLGITTDRLQALQSQAFVEASLSAEEFNATLNKMTKNLGEAAVAGGAPAEALARLGLNVKQLSREGVGDSFTEIAQKISEINDPMQRAITTTQIFGREGQKLAPLFAEGAEGIRKWHDEAVRAGQALNAVDVTALTDANEAIKTMEVSVTGLKNQFVIALGPSIIQTADYIRSLIPPAEEMRTVFSSAIRTISDDVKAVFPLMQQLGGTILSAGASAKSAVAGTAQFTAEHVALRQGVIVGTAALLAYSRATQAVGAYNTAAAGTASAFSAAELRATVAVERNAIAQATAAEASKALAIAQEEVAAAAKFATDAEWQETAAAEALAASSAAAATSLKAFGAAATASAATSAAAAIGTTSLWYMAGRIVAAFATPAAAAAVGVGVLAAAVLHAHQSNVGYIQSLKDIYALLSGGFKTSNEIEKEREQVAQLGEEFKDLQRQRSEETGQQEKLSLDGAIIEKLKERIAVEQTLAQLERAAGVDTGAAALLDSQKKLLDQLKAERDKAGGSAAQVAAPALDAASVKSLEQGAKHVTEILSGLKKQIESFGQEEGTAHIFDLKTAGASDTDIAQAQRYIDLLKQANDLKKLAEGVSSLSLEVKTTGLDGPMRKVADLYRELNALRANHEIDIDVYIRRYVEIQNLEKQIKAQEQAKAAIEDQKKDAEEYKRIWESVATPQEKAAEQIADLSNELAAGKIDADLYARAVAKIGDELDKATEKQEQLNRARAPDAIEQGSQAAAQALATAINAQVGLTAAANPNAPTPQSSPKQPSPQPAPDGSQSPRELTDATKQILDEDRYQTRLLIDMRDALKNTTSTYSIR